MRLCDTPDRHWHGVGTGLLIVCLANAAPGYADEATKAQEVQAPPTAETAAKPDTHFEVHSSDGSVLKVGLVNAKIPLKTDFGTLMIPVANIRRIDFASRAPESVAARVRAAIKNLGDEEYKTREAASAELRTMADAALPALMEAAESDDPEVVRRAEALLAQIRKTILDDDVQLRDFDLVYTDNSQIAGTIELASLDVDTSIFGRQKVELVHLRRLILPGEIDQPPGEVLPDPGDMMRFQNQVGKTLYFQLSAPPQGMANGAVWGTDRHTLDSNLVTAALHAGAIAAGQTKVVGVTIEGPQNQFTGSTRNGVTSGSWGQFPGAFTFKAPKGQNAGARNSALSVHSVTSRGLEENSP